VCICASGKICMCERERMYVCERENKIESVRAGQWGD